MIGSRRYRIAEPPRTSAGPAHSLPAPEPFPHLCAGPFSHFRVAPALRARAPPGHEIDARR
jgi:hypothetical protein